MAFIILEICICIFYLHTWKRLSLLAGGAAGLGISKPSLPSLTAPLMGLLEGISDGGAVTVFGGVSSLSSLRSSSAGREESQDRSLFSLVGDRHSSGGKVTYGVKLLSTFTKISKNYIPVVQFLDHPPAGWQCLSAAQPGSCDVAPPANPP